MKKKPADVEALAEEAKLKRQTKCSEAINKLLAEYKCQFSIFVQAGNVALPLDQVIKLPMTLSVVSK